MKDFHLVKLKIFHACNLNVCFVRLGEGRKKEAQDKNLYVSIFSSAEPYGAASSGPKKTNCLTPKTRIHSTEMGLGGKKAKHTRELDKKDLLLLVELNILLLSIGSVRRCARGGEGGGPVTITAGRLPTLTEH